MYNNKKGFILTVEEMITLFENLKIKAILADGKLIDFTFE